MGCRENASPPVIVLKESQGGILVPPDEMSLSFYLHASISFSQEAEGPMGLVWGSYDSKNCTMFRITSLMGKALLKEHFCWAWIFIHLRWALSLSEGSWVYQAIDLRHSYSTICQTRLDLVEFQLHWTPATYLCQEDAFRGLPLNADDFHANITVSLSYLYALLSNNINDLLTENRIFGIIHKKYLYMYVFWSYICVCVLKKLLYVSSGFKETISKRRETWNKYVCHNCKWIKLDSG